MPDVQVDLYGMRELEKAVAEISSPSVINRLMGPALGRAAAVVRQIAKRRDFGFRDQRGVRRAPDNQGPLNEGEGRPFVNLRRSIRSRRIRARYGGRTYKAGRAAVFAGGRGARQSHLVHEGHGGPYPARPHPFLRRALMQSTGAQATAFSDRVRLDFPKIASMIAARNSGQSISASFGRTVARRGRRG